MTEKKRIGASPHFYTLPLIRGLAEEKAFSVELAAIALNAIKLRNRDLNVAFLSPIDYAREASNYTIVPDVAVSSSVANNAVVLHFREGLHNITRMAVDPSSTSEIVLAKILLEEEFEIEPQLVPVQGDLSTMLQRADSALLVGDAALRESARHTHAIDLVETWYELTDLPYVHGFWCCREDASPADIKKIQQAKVEGVQSFAQIAEQSKDRASSKQSREALVEYLESFSYEMNQEAQTGLVEFLQYAYYHGVLPDIPELNFYPAAQEKDSADADRLLN
jgi:chorismate dehydratase